MTTNTSGGIQQPPEKHRQQQQNHQKSIFEVSTSFFDSCRIITPSNQSSSTSFYDTTVEDIDDNIKSEGLYSNNIISSNNNNNNSNSMDKWSCNTCKSEFHSLFDQRSHFKSDFHRFNVKLKFVGKDTLKEDDFDELTSDSFSKDFDVSSISGSEDEDEGGPRVRNSKNDMLIQSAKQKLFVRLHTGEKVSIWKSLILKDSENFTYENNQLVVIDDKGRMPSLKDIDVIEKLKALVHEPRDNTHFRIVLLVSGGHFAGCVFDGNTVVAHKTFHRYVVRAKAGKKQSSKDASGKSIHSAGASIRRYNELALKKDIQELLASWKPYFDASSCVFIYAPSNNRQLIYNGDTPIFSNQQCDSRNIPFSVRRPTFKEARRIYCQLCQVVYEIDEDKLPDMNKIQLNETCISNADIVKSDERGEATPSEGKEAFESVNAYDEQLASDESDNEIRQMTTPLHEAVKSDDSEKVLELLEQGLDPTVKDERGKTPYMLATEKEVRNTFRRFMAANLEKWDWHAANVPSPLTKEMEESQAAKQAEKDAKRKAKAKELKKLKKTREKEKKAQAKAAEEARKVSAVSESKTATSPSVKNILSGARVILSKEEEIKRKQAEEREKRAAAAERRLALAAATNDQVANTPASSSTSQPKSDAGISDNVCSCCNASLAGKVPFHRYNYKYCSTTCMHVHREVLEDG